VRRLAGRARRGLGGERSLLGRSSEVTSTGPLFGAKNDRPERSGIHRLSVTTALRKSRHDRRYRYSRALRNVPCHDGSPRMLRDAVCVCRAASLGVGGGGSSSAVCSPVTASA